MQMQTQTHTHKLVQTGAGHPAGCCLAKGNINDPAAISWTRPQSGHLGTAAQGGGNGSAEVAVWLSGVASQVTCFDEWLPASYQRQELAGGGGSLFLICTRHPELSRTASHSRRSQDLQLSATSPPTLPPPLASAAPGYL